MPFLLAKILNFQGSAHLIGVGSLSIIIKQLISHITDGLKRSCMYPYYKKCTDKFHQIKQFVICILHHRTVFFHVISPVSTFKSRFM